MKDTKTATVADLKPGDQFKIGRQRNFRTAVRILEMIQEDILVAPEDVGKRLIVLGDGRIIVLPPDQHLAEYLPGHTEISVGDQVAYKEEAIINFSITDPDWIALRKSDVFEVLLINGTSVWVKDQDGKVHEVYDKSIFQKVAKGEGI